MKGTSVGVARRIRENIGWPVGEVSGTVFDSGAAVGGAIFCYLSLKTVMWKLVFSRIHIYKVKKWMLHLSKAIKFGLEIILQANLNMPHMIN